MGRTPEEYIICAGVVPEGSNIYLGVFDKEDVLYTTGKLMDEAMSDYAENASCMLIFSCMARNLSLGLDSMAELELVMNKVGSSVPFMMTYSGGEICPTQVSDLSAINRFHNNTIVVCIL